MGSARDEDTGALERTRSASLRRRGTGRRSPDKAGGSGGGDGSGEDDQEQQLYDQVIGQGLHASEKMSDCVCLCCLRLASHTRAHCLFQQ